MKSSNSPFSDIYDSLNEGKGALQAKNFAEARRIFERAAKLDSADAMNYLGKLMWDGEGGPVDVPASLKWFERAAERGHSGAMENLVLAYRHLGGEQNLAASNRWSAVLAEARKLDGRISPEDARIVPMPPSDVMIE